MISTADSQAASHAWRVWRIQLKLSFVYRNWRIIGNVSDGVSISRTYVVKMGACRTPGATSGRNWMRHWLRSRATAMAVWEEIGEGWMERRAAAAADNWLVRTRRRRAVELVSCSRVTTVSELLAVHAINQRETKPYVVSINLRTHRSDANSRHVFCLTAKLLPIVLSRRNWFTVIGLWMTDDFRPTSLICTLIL